MPRRTPGYRKIANGTPPLNVDANRLAAFFTTIAVRPTVVELRKVLNLAGGHLSSFIQEMAAAYANIARIPDESARGRLFKELSKIERRHRRLFREQMRERVAVDVSSYLRHQDVRPVLRQAFERNWSLIKTIPPQAAAHLEKQLSVMSTFDRREVATAIDNTRTVTWRRARLIARDQNNKLVGQLSQMRQTAVGVEEYEWVTSADERVRPTHRAVSGEVFRWDSPPDIGHPGEDIQCRCHASPVWPKGAFARPKRPPPPPPPPPLPPGKDAALGEIEKMRRLIKATPAGLGHRRVFRKRIKIIEDAIPDKELYKSGAALQDDAFLKEALDLALKHEVTLMGYPPGSGKRGFFELLGDISQESQGLARKLRLANLDTTQRARVTGSRWRTQLLRESLDVIEPDLPTMIQQTEMLVKAATRPSEANRYKKRLKSLRTLDRYASGSNLSAAQRKRLADLAASLEPPDTWTAGIGPFPYPSVVDALTSRSRGLRGALLTTEEARLVGSKGWRPKLEKMIEEAKETRRAQAAAKSAARARSAQAAAAPRARTIRDLERQYPDVADPDAPVRFSPYSASRARVELKNNPRFSMEEQMADEWMPGTLRGTKTRFGSSAVDVDVHNNVSANARIEAERVRLAVADQADGKKAVRLVEDTRNDAYDTSQVADIYREGERILDEIPNSGIGVAPPGRFKEPWLEEVHAGVFNAARVADKSVLERAMKDVKIDESTRFGAAGWAHRDVAYDMRIGIDPAAKRNTVTHEIGHHIEGSSRGKNLNSLAQGNAAARTYARMLDEQDADGLRKVFMVERKMDEGAAYASKAYLKGNKIKSSELISEGIRLMSDPDEIVRFATDSPEWFRYTYLMLRGHMSKPARGRRRP